MPSLFSLPDLHAAAALIRPVVPPTPQIVWPLLAERVGAEVWVKHENHTPTGAFKVRGGLVLMDRLKREHPDCPGIVSATRGNHGQSLAYAGRRAGVPVTIVVPHGNGREKNAAMRALGAELIEAGADFDAARAEAARIAEARGLRWVPAFGPELVTGVATYALELFTAAPDLDAVYVPIGSGSGICAVIGVRDLLGLRTEVIGVTAAGAPAFARSFAAGHIVEGCPADTFADGVAVRQPPQLALDIVRAGAARIVEVTDAEIAEAMRAYYTDTHNIAEGAGATPLAAVLQERETMRGRKVAAVLSGGNVDRDVYARVLGEAQAA
ncbi:threonine dehydratase [Caenispirillum bisanense]|uniref:Threonine dehydratase n=1 Tax=Caenispirillum bisanense TaxID=414052 RepID=A0A286H0D6_9PROT|nr:threonine dehydratase [Caenispirillum bisanense]SOE01258.1 threonine dehydratase [Caenispirillum bisanense]